MAIKTIQNKRFLLLAAAVTLSAGCASMLSHRAFPKETSKAVWVWNTEDICSEESADSFVSFCEGNGVGLVFLYLRKDFNKVRTLVSKCSKGGIVVHALTGTPEMAKPENHRQALRFIAKVIQYNADSKRSERITGIHLDVEPYLQDEFKSGEIETVLSDYVELIKTVNKYIYKRDRKLVLGADIPFWLDKQSNDGTYKYAVESQGQTKPVYEHVIDYTDYICIMSYRNYVKGKGGVLDISSDEIAYAASKGKKVFVGLETGSGEGIPEKTTFAEKDVSIFKNSVRLITEALIDEPSFSGVAIHHYRTWRSLEE